MTTLLARGSILVATLALCMVRPSMAEIMRSLRLERAQTAAPAPQSFSTSPAPAIWVEEAAPSKNLSIAPTATCAVPPDGPLPDAYPAAGYP